MKINIFITNIIAIHPSHHMSNLHLPLPSLSPLAHLSPTPSYLTSPSPTIALPSLSTLDAPIFNIASNPSPISSLKLLITLLVNKIKIRSHHSHPSPIVPLPLLTYLPLPLSLHCLSLSLHHRRSSSSTSPMSSSLLPITLLVNEIKIRPFP